MSSLEGFISELGNIPVSTDPAVIAAKSRDAYALSPLLKKTLRGRLAEAVVSPRSKTELAIILSAAWRHGVALTPRAAGTANYGQSVPLRGGAMLDMSGLAGVIWVKQGAIRAHAGTTIDELEEAASATGQELRFFPTTRQHATIGGFIAGGTGGVGSITWGVLRDPGNILAVEAMGAVENPVPREFRGPDARMHHHAYGTTGVITEVEMPLAPALPWRECIAGFSDYAGAIGFAVSLGRTTGISKKLISAYEWPIGHWLQALRPLVPEGASIVTSMIAEGSIEAYRALLREYGGRLLSEAPEGEASYGQPLHRFAFGHTTMQVKKTMPKLTEVEGFFRADDLAGLIMRVHAALGGIGPMRMEIRHWAGDLVGSGSPFIDFKDEAQVADVVRIMQAEGIKVANPHASNVRGVGKKEIGPREIALKREMDPRGLLNPGRFEVDGQDQVIDEHLPTDGWVSRAAE